ncbi:methyltransferase domain-containing protein [Candidatus Pacearchaeota archaeon]|jgi:ubiquinone/menaquinone biosynthesis C-methylase UbiE|nr:methyltransferase domain-containing protein [Candidatus Pacearchaeota archaeon]
MKLNLGCGNDYREGYINCDISPEVNPDKIVDLEKKLPFQDNSVDEIIIEHVMEHFHEPLKLLKEFYRVCKNEAIIKIKVPYFSHESAFSMLDHYHQFTLTSFDALDKKHTCHWQSIGNFKIIKKKLYWRKGLKFFETFFNSNPKILRIYQELFCWIIPARELEIVLKVIK